MSKCSKTTSH